MWARLRKLFRSNKSAPANGRFLGPKRRQTLHRLEEKLGIRFHDLSLLNQSLVHRSFLNGKAATRIESNERMEFLGDSVLGLVVNEHLYEENPEENEGNLTKIKSLVVSRQILAQKAEEIGLGRFLLLSPSESESGGRTRVSIIADALEAVICAVYLDQGLPAARRFIHKLVIEGMDEITGDEENINYKSLLQERVQSERKVHPVYRIRREQGPDHQKTFQIEVSIAGRVAGHGEGHTKKEAEQAAARNALKKSSDRKGRRRSRGRGRRRRSRRS